MKKVKKDRQTEAGFTLVELVVVIAILGILAGVGYVAYGGYIKYADKGADEVVLDAANDAFAAACEEQGIDRYVLPTGGARLKGTAGGKTIEGVNSVRGVSDLDALNALFDKYYEGNEGNILKYYTTNQIRFDGDKDLFVFNDQAIADPVDTFNNSGMNRESMSQPMRSVVFALKKLGFVNENESLEDNITSLCEKFKLQGVFDLNKDYLMQRLIDMGLDPTLDTTDPNEFGNALVMIAAEDTISGGIDTEELKKGVLNNEKNLKQYGFAALPMAMIKYSAYYQYNLANGEPDADFVTFYRELTQTNAKGEWNQTNGVSGSRLSSMMSNGFAGYTSYKDFKNHKFDENETYQEFLNSGYADKAMDGYLSALSLLVDNKDAYDMDALDALGTQEFKDYLASLGITE